MKRIWAVTGMVAALAAGGWTAATIAEFQLTPDSQVWVEGTSTVRDYKCEAGDMIGEVTTVNGELSLDEVQNDVESLSLVIQVDALDCKNGTMNNHMKKALLLEDHPTIEYRATEVYRSIEEDGSTVLTLGGELHMAGQSQLVSLRGVATSDASGAIRFTGEVGFDMTLWGIKPPSLMFGTMKVRGPVVVHYDVMLGLTQ